ncbi:hypothetical protein FEM48_Zijuj01G0200700 [Ziziphus jujuba var. spinosa]|uniref:Secreted protein n=1 Tax=Ziziphus jujuba var. spinosa TaxID=714518 RepID=A0A978W3A2_ZIZJJ|nr:hypothetical protein FEM48_Zijuj01G0200700 [Ziziphus jujuba var. spinosa]
MCKCNQAFHKSPFSFGPLPALLALVLWACPTSGFSPFASIKRVVVTSSFASVAANGKPLTPDVVVGETWFSDFVYCGSRENFSLRSTRLLLEAQSCYRASTTEIVTRFCEIKPSFRTV